ncbi:hypothetical protein BOTBODRAFT_146317 [Botryobasidium botryosum FD-172 SS1]|uniref:Uncharacterized protein n=1 Tax=Botryobasidium botryosum (strain FD-172 SS1) TaxID=930990 RepID=A0A067MMX5_BOTB1|nr:hypothetical protein BOTBODRAFT_146317 [Botryobasidium botryosum FD-172 SS1]
MEAPAWPLVPAVLIAVTITPSIHLQRGQHKNIFTPNSSKEKKKLGYRLPIMAIGSGRGEGFDDGSIPRRWQKTRTNEFKLKGDDFIPIHSWIRIILSPSLGIRSPRTLLSQFGHFGWESSRTSAKRIESRPEVLDGEPLGLHVHDPHHGRISNPHSNLKVVPKAKGPRANGVDGVDRGPGPAKGVVNVRQHYAFI